MRWTVWSFKCPKSKSNMAPRPPRRASTGLARGAWLAACLGLAGQASAETIVTAQFGGETDVYAHCILGDCIEYQTLEITTEDWANRTRYRVTLPADHVFEDIAPRLWDITADGKPEVIVIETDIRLGGSLAVYDQSGKIGETPHIGRSNRWLAPIGAADFDGDGRIEVAFVDRPHLAKVVRVFEWTGTELVLETEIAGLTNHRIGEDFISGGIRDCGTGAQMVTANADWSLVMITSFDAGWVSTPAGPFSPSRLAQVLDCAG